MNASWRRWAVAAGFWCYSVALVVAARRVGHQLFAGWLARLTAMAAVAVGLWPWAHWLRPRFLRLAALFGWTVLVICYVTLLWPFALILRLGGDVLWTRRMVGSSRWRTRVPLHNTLDAARVEW